MRQREFIAALGGAAAAWPVVAHAQQTERVRRIGLLMTRRADDPARQAQLAAFIQGLQERGWNLGHNMGFRGPPRLRSQGFVRR
jgi:putative ABC transport system substrate-binding protein